MGSSSAGPTEAARLEEPPVCDALFPGVVESDIM
jgi:hypothetical protein